MKRRITTSIAVTLSVVLLTTASFTSKATAAPPLKYHADSGIVALGPNQMLRVMVANRLDTASIRFTRIEYTQDSCDAAGACKHIISSQTTSNLITLAPGEGASFDIAGHETQAAAVRGVVSINLINVQVTAVIIDTTTGKVDSFFDIFVE